jgi:hypothetical protein
MSEKFKIVLLDISSKKDSSKYSAFISTYIQRIMYLISSEYSEAFFSVLPDSFFKPKIPIWVKFLRVLQWKTLVYLLTLGLFYGHLEHFTTVWNIFGHFGIFLPILECCTK